MSDEQTTTETTQQEPQDRQVPYERFQQKVQEANDLKRQLQEFASRFEEFENRDKTGTDLERAKREQAERKLKEYETTNTDLSARLTRMERGSWVRDAAAAANFHNPSTAVNLIDLSGVESPEDAEKAIKQLAKREKYLVRDEQPAPQIGRVLANGQRVDPNAPQRDEQADAFMAQIRAAQDSDGWSSLPLQ